MYANEYGWGLNKSTLRLYLSAGASRPTRVVPIDDVAVNNAVSRGLDQITISHDLLTANFVLALSPSWNTNCYITEKTATTFTVRFSTPAILKTSSLTWRAKRGNALPVSSGAESLAIVHGLNNINAKLFFTPWWNTTVRLQSQAANGVIVDFETPPFGDSFVDYGEFRLANSVDFSEELDGQDTYRINHNLNYKFCDIFLTPTWNTRIWITERYDNYAIATFSTTPPEGARIAWRARTAELDGLAGNAQPGIIRIPDIQVNPEDSMNLRDNLYVLLEDKYKSLIFQENMGVNRTDSVSVLRAFTSPIALSFSFQDTLALLADQLTVSKPIRVSTPADSALFTTDQAFFVRIPPLGYIAMDSKPAGTDNVIVLLQNLKKSALFTDDLSASRTDQVSIALNNVKLTALLPQDNLATWTDQAAVTLAASLDTFVTDTSGTGVTDNSGNLVAIESALVLDSSGTGVTDSGATTVTI